MEKSVEITRKLNDIFKVFANSLIMQLQEKTTVINRRQELKVQRINAVGKRKWANSVHPSLGSSLYNSAVIMVN